MRVAAFDLGSNSFHLLVADADARLGIAPIETKKEMVRLGEQSLVAGVIPRPTLDRALRTLTALKETAARHLPEATRAVATSAVREARNRDEFIRRAREEAGLDVAVLPGREEARLCYVGALSGTAATGAGRVALFDLGGGSLEIAVGDGDRVVHTASVRVGALRLARELPTDGAPCLGELPALRARIEDRLRPMIASAGVGVAAPPGLRVAFSGGTARALARVAAFDQVAAAGARLAVETVRELVRRLAGMTAAQRAAVPGLEPGRLDSIVPGALVLETLLALTGATCADVCQRGLREGIVLDHLRRVEEAERRASGAAALATEPAASAAAAANAAATELRPPPTAGSAS